MRALDLQSRTRIEKCLDPAICYYLAALTHSQSCCLEIGCGPGQYRLVVQGEYFGIDITKTEYYEGLPRTPDALADAMHLPFASNTFTLVFYSNTFHFLPDPEHVLAEAIRVLRPNGLVVIFDYSRTTVKRLMRTFATYNPPLEARPWTCTQWTQFLRHNGLSDVCIWRKTPRHPPWLRRIIAVPLISHLYRALVDMREGSIVLMGRKPFKP